MESGLSKKLIFFLSIICAITVGNLYLAQPLLAAIADSFHVSSTSVGIVATLAQVGYGLGVLLIVPLGDLFERRFLILSLLTAVTCALVFAGCSTTQALLCIASFCVGLFTVIPQVVIPYAASLAKPHERASVMGTVQSGLLIGILLARTVSGAIASALGWHAVYFCFAAFMVLVAGIIWSFFPKQQATTRLSYLKLLSSMWGMFWESSSLRRVCIASALNFAAFSVFWTTLSFFLESSFHLGPGVAGLFGIIGVVGAVTASLAGRVADKRGTLFAQRIAYMVTVSSFMIYFLSVHSIWILIVGVILMDAGNQAAHISCQAEVFSGRAEFRSRLNGIYMFFRFIGGAMGSFLGAWGWARAEWMGVCSVGLVLSLLCFVPSRQRVS